MTGYTPFEVTKSHNNTSDPFELTEKKIVSNYIQNHEERVKILYEQIKNKIQNKEKSSIN